MRKEKDMALGVNKRLGYLEQRRGRRHILLVKSSYREQHLALRQWRKQYSLSSFYFKIQSLLLKKKEDQAIVNCLSNKNTSIETEKQEIDNLHRHLFSTHFVSRMC